MRSLSFVFCMTLFGCATTTATPPTGLQVSRDEFGYPELSPELLQTSVKIAPLQVTESADSMPPLVKTKRRTLKSVEEPEDPEFIEERKKNKIPSRFVPYEGADRYQRVSSGQEQISVYALSLAQTNRLEVSREQEPTDGSSFVRKVLHSTNVGMLPRGAEKQSRALATSSYFEGVKLDELQPGDVVFWSGLKADSRLDTPSHVGIFVGENTVVTQWPGRGILKLRLEGVLAPPQLLRAYRVRVNPEES